MKIFQLPMLMLLLSGPISTHAQQPASATPDSLLRQLSLAKHDTARVSLYMEIIWFHINNNPQKGIAYIQPAMELSAKHNYQVSEVLAIAGRLYWKLGKMDRARQLHIKALGLIDSDQNPDEYAQLLIYIGQDYADGGNYQEALKYFSQAKEFYESIENPDHTASTYLLISWVYNQQGDFINSSKNNLEALRIYEAIGDEYGYSIAAGNLAGDYIKLDKNEEARLYVLKVIPIIRKANDVVNLSSHYRLLAEIQINLKKYDEAIMNADTAYSIGESVNDRIQMGEALSLKAQAWQLQNQYEKAAEMLEAAVTNYKAVNASHLIADNYSRLAMCYSRLNQPLKARAANDSASLYNTGIESPALMARYLNGLHLYDSLTGNWRSAYFNYSGYIQIRDSIYNADNTKKLLQNQVQYEFDKKEAIAKAEQEKKDIKERNIRNSIAGALGGALIFLMVVYRQRNKISKARKRSDELLLNILPEETAEELKQKGTAAARHFDIVTVMFTDFKNFTQASEKMTPQELVQEIHYCYSEFDKIVSRHRLEKIKTIGDSYMCAGGLPAVNTTNAHDIVTAAIEICEFMQQEKQRRTAEGKPFFEIRIGCHTGPVVAGIVGIKKFAYDIWGDTVNIASRMESSGETGRVNISGTTYEKVKDQFHCMHRGKISAKNKGEIDMYFVERKG